MRVTSPEALGAYLPVVSAHLDQGAVADANGRGLSRDRHQSPDRVLSGELLPGQRNNDFEVQAGAPGRVSLVPISIGPQARAVAAYSENSAALRLILPRIDLRI